MSIRLTIAAVCGAAVMVASGFADAMPQRAYDETVGGQLEAKLADGYVAAELLHTDIDARVLNNIAEVHIRQVFAGMGSAASDATYLLPLGAGAEVIAIEVAEGTRVERKALDQAPERPGLPPRMFIQDLVLGGDVPVEITLIYRFPIQKQGESRAVVLPITTLPGGSIDDALLSVDQDSPEYADLPAYLGGEVIAPKQLTHDRINLTLTFENPPFAGVYSDTHAIDITATQDARIVELAPSQPIANRTFVLKFETAETAETDATIVAHADRSR